jgi:HEAT repeat protein
MKAHLKKTLALAILAATLPAQTTDYAAALQRAELIERQEGDLGAAQLAYEALLDQDAVPQAVETVAQFNLGSLLWRLGKRDEARVILTKVTARGGKLANNAKLILASESAEAQGKQERIERARAILKRIAELREQPGDQPNTDHLLAGLRQLDSAAAQAIVEQLNVGPALRNDGKRLIKQHMLAFLIRQLWEIGTEPAQQFLLDAAKNGPLPWQRFLTGNYNNKMVIAADLALAVQQFTQTSDPTGEVWLNATNRLRGLDDDAIAACLASGNGSTREAGLTDLARRWSKMAYSTRAKPFLNKHQVTLKRAFDYQDKRRKQATWDLLSNFLQHGPNEASAIFLEEVQAHPDAKPSLDLVGARTGDDAWLHQVATTARTLGKLNRNEERPLHSAVKQLVSQHKPQWTVASLADVEALVQLGYAKGQLYGSNTCKWLHQYVQLATPKQRIDLLLQLPDMAEARDLANDLSRLNPTPEFLPAVEQVLQQCTGDNQIPWFNESQTKHQSIGALAMLAATSEHPDAGRVVAEFTMRQPHIAESTYAILCSLSLDRSDEPARSALRKLLVMTQSQKGIIDPRMRNTIFGELVRAGDTKTIPLLSQAYQLGLRHSGFSYPNLQPYTDRPVNRPSIQGKGIQLLTEQNSPSSVRHHYSPTDLANAWESLLTGDASDEVWRDLSPNATGAYATQSVPVAALAAFGNQLLARWLSSKNTPHPLDRILYSYSNVTPESLPTNPGLRESIQALLTSPHQELAAGIFAYLDDAVAQEFATTGIEQFRASKSLNWFRALIGKKIPLGREDWLAALSGDRVTQWTALSGIPKDVDPTVRLAVEALLGHSEASIRLEACKALTRSAGPETVGLLLPLLQDESVNVRKGVRALLAQMREEQEQRNFWARVGDVELTPATAAAKLIGQAMPSEDKQQRLLAIRSLALLNAPESLPYLIDWTKDQDTDIQAVAKKAIADIHQRGATMEPAKKK